MAICLGASRRADALTLFTIGYEGRVQDEVLDALEGAGVRLLIDVRAVASSRKAGFSKTLLAASLDKRGIGYVHLVALGTPKAGREAARAGRAAEMHRIFGAHLKTDAAQAALAEATALARGTPACLLCFEADPACCHRTIVAAEITRVTRQPVAHL